MDDASRGVGETPATGRVSCAYVVCDLGFGDAGKGLATDALVRRTGAGLVVRYNGGAQAGHNVVTPEGHHHTFSQLGAGSFVPGVRTFLSRHVVVHPTGLVQEARRFDGVMGGTVLSRLGISRRARVITPFHQALNRLRELSRGEGRHGSCGVGVGETVADALAHPDDVVRAEHLREPGALKARLERVRERLLAQARALWSACEAQGGAGTREAHAELQLFLHPEVIGRWVARSAPLVEAGCIVEDAVLSEWAGDSAVVFEGAQGVLLDESIGFHPHTTWTDCTPRQALALISESLRYHRPIRLGLLRSHAVRHGNGPFPTEAPLGVGVDDHNQENPWQGRVRYGWFDAVLARYALERCGGVDWLGLTHLDLIVRRGGIQGAAGYAPAPGEEAAFQSWWQRGEQGRRIAVPADGDLAAQEALGAWLQRGVIPRLETLPDAPSFVAWVEAELGVPVGLTSEGRTAGHVRLAEGLAP